MKFTVTLKTPDALYDSLQDAVQNETGGDEDRYHELFDETMKLCERWFKYGEYVTLEIDTEKKTCKVSER